MNEINYDFNELLKKSILIYGFGKTAKIAIQALRSEGADIVGIAVSDHDGAPERYNGIEVNAPEKWKDAAKDVVVLIATTSTHHKAICSVCMKTGFENIIPLSTELKNDLFCRYYDKWFSEKNVFREKDIIIIGKGKYLSPFSTLKNYSSTYLDEFGDFIAPAVFEDYEMINEGPYELDEVKLSENDIVFDLGANLGLFSVYAASKGCVSYAFEPNPQLHDIIADQSRLNTEKIKLVPYAVSDQCGTTTLRLDNVDSANSIILNSAAYEYEDVLNSSIESQQVTIDEFVSREKITHIDFIKADIEGAERLMIAGAQNTLRKFAPKLSLCTYHLPDDKEVLTKLILEANPNYKIKYKWKKLYACV